VGVPDSNPSAGPVDKKGVYIGLISFAGDVTAYNNGGLSYLDSSLAGYYSPLLNNYQIATQSGTALFYAVHQALANLTAAESTLPADIESVNLITFTDGLDTGSFGASNANPIESKSAITSTEYATYVNGEISSRTIGGKHINAYSIGVKGSDVTGDTAVAQFDASLSNIASSAENVHLLTNYDDLQATLDNIADSIPVKVSFTMKTPQGDPDTVIRMTFGVYGTNPSDAAAATSYIDGTLAYDSSTGKYSLTSILHSADITFESGTTIEGVTSGTEVSFTFKGITGYSSAAVKKQWTKPSADAPSWQINSEFSADNATGMDSTTLVYLVLDASTSLSSYEIGQIKSAVNSFITRLYDRTH
jgi:hypothetical protein